MNLVTTILTVYNRLDYLESQIESIKNQTVESDIFIHWNTSEEYTLKYPSLIYKNQHKSAPLYNRFIHHVNISTPYIFICDDDILPGKDYLRRGIDFIEKKNSCIVNYGMILKEGSTNYEVRKRIGYDTLLEEPKQVDMGGQGYLFKSELLRNFCNYKIHDDKWGEDIHLGFVCYMENIPMYVLDSDKYDENTSRDMSKGKRGIDGYAQWRFPTHKPVRDKLIGIYSDLGWKFNLSKSTII
jgi:hypothetical protein